MTLLIHRGFHSAIRFFSAISDVFDLSGSLNDYRDRMIVPPSPSEGIYNAFHATGSSMQKAMLKLAEEQTLRAKLEKELADKLPEMIPFPIFREGRRGDHNASLRGWGYLMHLDDAIALRDDLEEQREQKEQMDLFVDG